MGKAARHNKRSPQSNAAVIRKIAEGRRRLLASRLPGSERKRSRQVEEAFLDGLRGGWSISKSARAAGIHERTVRRWKADSTASGESDGSYKDDFAQRWDDAYECGVDSLEDAAKRRHLVRVRYRVPMLLENISLTEAQPLVQVIGPKLERHWDYEEGPIPHVYKSEIDPSLPYLCLFSPSLREWDICDLIADTTIFWANEWLYFYEGWLITKKWRGGGRHVGPVIDGAKQLETV